MIVPELNRHMSVLSKIPTAFLLAAHPLLLWVQTLVAIPQNMLLQLPPLLELVEHEDPHKGLDGCC